MISVKSLTYYQKDVQESARKLQSLLLVSLSVLVRMDRERVRLACVDIHICTGYVMIFGPRHSLET